MSSLPGTLVPETVPNWIGGEQRLAGERLEKADPATGKRQRYLARSTATDVAAAVAAARQAQVAWGRTPAVRRGAVLGDITAALRARREDVARVVAQETGKSLRDALGETDGAIALGAFMAGEGQRLYGRTTTCGTPHKTAMTVRQPVGVAGLIIAANTPIANVAWKVFPALICGNGAVLKAAEDTPGTAWLFADIAQRAGLPAGVLNVVQGLGPEAGAALVEHPDVGVLSFTGSTAVGRWIAETAGRRLAKVSLELGGKNPFVVCDDADLDHAVKWACLSAYSNAGQRCASGSRIIVTDAVYESFRDKLVAAAKRLRVGTGDDDDLGPVINERAVTRILTALAGAQARGARILAGGERLRGAGYDGGYFLAPTVVEGVSADDEISVTELFGPVTNLYRVADYEAALALANRSPYGLTASIHTRSFDRAVDFVYRVQAGIAVVNAGTYGSEPHMPFGGVKQSGNGSREPGTEALDIYSDLKDIYFTVDPARLS